MSTIEKNRLEWIVFAVSLALVAATFAYLIREALTTRESPPDVVVTLGEPRSGTAGFMVPVVATNQGGKSAEDVQITVTLELPGGATHESALVLAFLPRESNRQGWLTFPADPRAGSLRVSSIAFQEP